MSCRSAGISRSSNRRVPIRASRVIDETHARDELHREETALVLDEQLVEAHQIRVRHIGEASELSFQAIEVGRAGPKQGLQCDDFVADRCRALRRRRPCPPRPAGAPPESALVPGKCSSARTADAAAPADARETSAYPRGPPAAASLQARGRDRSRRRDRTYASRADGSCSSASSKTARRRRCRSGVWLIGGSSPSSRQTSTAVSCFPVEPRL